MQGCLQSGSMTSSPVRVIPYRQHRRVCLDHGCSVLTSLRVLAILQCDCVSQAWHGASADATRQHEGNRGGTSMQAEHTSWRSARCGKRSEEVRSMPSKPNARRQEALQLACTNPQSMPHTTRGQPVVCQVAHAAQCREGLLPRDPSQQLPALTATHQAARYMPRPSSRATLHQR